MSMVSLATQLMLETYQHSPRTRCALLKGLFAGNCIVDYYTLDIESRQAVDS